MKILFFVHTLSRTRHFRGVVSGLLDRGHTLVLATAGRTEPQKAGKGDYDHSRLSIVACPKARSDGWGEAAENLRRGRDRLRYVDPRFAHATALTERATAHTPRGWVRAVERHPWLRRHWRVAQRALGFAETLIPCDPAFLSFIEAHNPDLILVTPLVEFGSYQTDYVKCAHHLGIPVAYLPFSWDNLTNRGLIRVVPDRVLVWNRHQQAEAHELHGVPLNRIVVTGAPRFDEFFAMGVSSPREEFCRQLGFDPQRPLILYLCSSGFVAPREVDFVRRWVRELRQAPPGGWLRQAQVLVRPHPAYVEDWVTADLSDLEGVVIWSRRSKIQSDRGLYDSLYHATAVVGLNTSAMIEAAIVGRGVFTVAAPEFAGGQGGTLHFHYLLVENGGVVSLASDFAAHTRQLATAPESVEACRQRSRQFLETFVRPHGLDRPASGVMVEDIERVAAIRKRRTPPPAWHTPLRRVLAAALSAASERTSGPWRRARRAP